MTQRRGPDVNIGSGDVSLKCRWEYTAEGDISIREEPSQGIRATSGGESRLERGGGVYIFSNHLLFKGPF